MTKINVNDILTSYDKKNLTIATVCSHSSLQIFNGARKEGFKTLGISIGEQKNFYDAFPLGKPDDFLIIDRKLVFTEIEGINFITDSPDALTSYYDLILNKASMYKEIKSNIITKMYNKNYINLLESINIEKNGWS